MRIWNLLWGDMPGKRARHLSTLCWFAMKCEAFSDMSDLIIIIMIIIRIKSLGTA